ncbi:MAG: DUF222 domain-containing protein, partial [Acidobacteria bacterium]|nr:DUF222 domain-containing protein [Acidobacteriota bacterium]
MSATAALVPATSSDFPTSTVASPPSGASMSIEEHRAAVLQRRDEAERLGNDIAELAARIQAATYELLVMIRAFDQREGWSGFKSCAHWLNWRTGLALGAAREKVRVARALGDLPLLSDAMQRGRISYSKVRALTRVATAANERRLLGFAECAPAAYVERLARAWCRVDRQAEATDERRRHERRNLTTWVDDDGMVVIRGRLSPEVGAVVRRALEAAGDQLRTDVSLEEAADISFGQRQADALSVVAESALAAGLDRGAAGDRYQVVLHVDAETLGSGAGEGPEDVSAETLTSGETAEDVAIELSDGLDVSAETPRIGAGEGAEDVSAETPRTTAEVPAKTPRMTGHAALEDADGLRVSTETARRMACDAGTVVMVEAADGSVLDVGRKTRTIPPALRRALQARDHGCRFPGCNARRTDAHHVRHWADGGATRLDNLVLLCRRHHRAVHEEGFSVRVGPTGDAAFCWPDGRPFPDAPAAPRWTGPPLAPTGAHLAAAGIEIGPDTATPDWHGERLDLGYAI